MHVTLTLEISQVGKKKPEVLQAIVWRWFIDKNLFWKLIKNIIIFMKT